MASKSSITIGLITIVLIFGLAEADILTSPSPTTTNNFGSCPRDPLQIGVCARVLGLADVAVGDPRARPCCNALDGLTTIQLTDCLCFVFRDFPVVFFIDRVARIFSACDKAIPFGFQCPPPPTASLEKTMG